MVLFFTESANYMDNNARTQAKMEDDLIFDVHMENALTSVRNAYINAPVEDRRSILDVIRNIVNGNQPRNVAEAIEIGEQPEIVPWRDRLQPYMALTIWIVSTVGIILAARYGSAIMQGLGDLFFDAAPNLILEAATRELSPEEFDQMLVQVASNPATHRALAEYAATLRPSAA